MVFYADSSSGSSNNGYDNYSTTGDSSVLDCGTGRYACCHAMGACCSCLGGSLCCGTQCCACATKCSGFEQPLSTLPPHHPLFGVLAPPSSPCAWYGPKVAWCTSWVSVGVLIQVLAVPESVFPPGSSPYATEAGARRLVAALLMLGVAFMVLSLACESYDAA